jgi:hypothetical protein
METLTTPSREVALQTLQEVGFEDRLTGSILHVRAGIRVLSLYSLEDVFVLLKEPYPQIDLDQLESWIRTAIKDGELADRIKAVISKATTEQASLPLIRDLVGWRLIQCKRLAEGKG